MRLTPLSELNQRVSRFQHSLAAQNLDGALISQNADLFYFSGTMQTAQLLIPTSGAPLLMVRRSLERAQQESELEGVIPLPSLRDLPSLMASRLGPGQLRLGLEMDVLPANTYFALQRLLPDALFSDVSGLIRSTRSVKSPYEIAIQREAAVLLDRVFAAVPSLVRPGMSEVELAGLLEAEARRLGHPGFVRMRFFNQEIFYGHVLSGENGAMSSFTDSPTGGAGLGPSMPQGAGKKAIIAGEPVFIDLVAVVDGLMVDQTRVFAIDSLPRQLIDAHQAMLVVQDEVSAAARPGARCGELFALAHRVASELGMAASFMGFDENRPQFVGHGVGLELNDLPVLARASTTELALGNVIALEPKCLFVGRGAVGIENTWLVDASGFQRLTITPDDLRII